MLTINEYKKKKEEEKQIKTLSEYATSNNMTINYNPQKKLVSNNTGSFSTGYYKKQLEEAEKNYESVSNEYGEGFQKWKKETRKDDNLIEKTLHFLGDAFTNLDRDYYDKKYNAREELNEAQRKKNEAQANYEQSLVDSKPESSTVEKIMLPLGAGLDTGVQGLTTAINKVASVLPGQDMQNYNTSPTILQREYQKARSETNNPLMKVYQDLSYTTGNMIPTMVMPGSKSALLMTGATSFGSSYNQAREEGKTDEQATKYGILSGTSEAFLQKALGGISSIYGKSLLSKTVSPKVEQAFSKLIKNDFVRKMIAEAGSEFTEEYLQTTLEPVFRNIALDENNEFKPFTAEALYSGFLGALNSGVMNSVYALGNRSINTTTIPQNTQQSIRNQIENQVLGNNESTTNTNINANKNINPLENLETFKQNQQEIKNQKIQEGTTNQEVNAQQNLEKLSTKQNNNMYNFTGNAKLDFSEQVDQWKQGNIKQNEHLVVLKEMPELYRQLGLENQPMTLISSKLDRVYNKNGKQSGRYHGLGELVKQLPEAIDKPLNIIESKDDSIVAITDLSDDDGNIVIASIKINGNGQIEIDDVSKNIPAHVLTSSYGRENYDYQLKPHNGDYTGWMEENKKSDRIIYDIDEGIKKQRVNGQWLSLPNSKNSFSDNNSTTDSTKSQITPLPSQNNMQQETENDTKIPSSKENKEKISIPAVRQNSDVLKVQSERIANQINKTGDIDLKERSWVETSTESEILKDKVLISDLDASKISYVVQSNKKSLDKANNYLNTYGYDETLKHVNELLKNEQLPSASDVVLIQRMIQEASKKGDAETVQNLIMDTAILGTDLGQATQALSIIQRLTPEGQLKLYTKIVQRAKARGEKSFQNVEITPEMVQNILEAYKVDGTYNQDDLNARVEKFKQDIANQMETTTAEKINTWRYLAMLGNPKTHIRNLVSNVAMKYTLKAKNAVARTLETVIPVESKTKTWKKASDVVQKFADKTTVEMKNIITGEAKYSDKGSIEAKKQIFQNKTLEKISDFNSNALMAEDWYFSKSAFISTFQEYLTANGISTETDIKNNPEIIEKAKIYAVEQAEIATFRQYSKLASLISQAERKSKFARFAIEATIPFKKTPINVAKAGFKYSPLGLVKNVSYDVYQLQKGNINGSQFIDNLSQGLTGTSLTLIGYALAKAGFLSGAGDDDKEGKYDYNLGKQSYALNIGGTSYSISWLSPVAIPLLVGANAYEKLEEQEDWNPDVIADTLAQTLDPLSEMSFVSSLTDVLTSYSSGSTTMIKDIGETGVQSYILQFFPTLFSQFANVLDDKKRSTKVSNNSSFKFGEETLRKIMYKIPGLRNQLEVATDIWGNEKEQSSNILERALESFIAPYSKTKDISTSLDNEIKKVYNETGETGVIPSIPYAYTKYQGMNYRMSASEYTSFKKTYGQIANNCLNQLINSNSYQKASPDEQAKMMSNVYDYARAKANEEYFESYDVDYENDILKKINVLNKSYGITASSYFANKNQYDYAYQNPEKYAVISQITSYDKYTTYKEKIDDIRDNTTNDKTAIIKYINSLSLSIPQKAMFIKMYYPSFDNYDSQIIRYINSQKITKAEKETILKKIGFNVKDGRVY